jgi:anti-sigma-K factor RskA
MTRSEPPEDWQDLMAGYALGNLDPDEAEALHQLLTTHPELVAELRAYQESLALLPYDLPPQLPITNLEAAIVKVIEDQPRSPEVASSRMTTTNPRFDWHLLLFGLGSAIAAATMLLLTIDNERLRQQMAQVKGLEQKLQTTQTQLEQLQQQQETLQPLIATLQQPNTLIYSLQGTGQAATASASLVAVPGHRQMVLVSHNLPPLPKDKVYRLWAIHDQASELMYCGQFTSTPTGTAKWLAPDEACSQKPRKVIITLDSVTASTSSGGSLVMQSRRV